MVVLGVDVHKATHTAVAVDEMGRQLGQRTVRAAHRAGSAPCGPPTPGINFWVSGGDRAAVVHPGLTVRGAMTMIT
jgi:hypothetical protein